MITPENYYLKYKKIITLFSEKIIFLIISILFLLCISAFYEFNKNQISKTFIQYIISIILFFFGSGYIIKKARTKKLMKLTNKKDITTANFHEEFDIYKIKRLRMILKENHITKDIYETFYRQQLNNYLQSTKNFFGENAYISFIVGTIYASFLQGLLGMANNPNEFFGILIIVIIFSVVIIFIIKQIKQDNYKYEQVYNLIFYTEIIFSESNIEEGSIPDKKCNTEIVQS